MSHASIAARDGAWRHFRAPHGLAAHSAAHYITRKPIHPFAPHEDWSLVAQLIIKTAVWLVGLALLLFVSAGTLHWPGAWVYLAEIGVVGTAVGIWLANYDPGLFAERMAGIFTSTQRAWDRALMMVFTALWIASLVLSAFDAARFQWSHVPVWLQVVGALLIALAYYVFYLTFRENSYAAPIVAIQSERGHRVVSSGPYAVVRHPMYAGALPFFIGTPLLLGSWWGLAATPLLLGLLVMRAVKEERTLVDELPGYRDYATRVRYRLVPHIW
jgi:protein-S-isoprenylcysteine O-methyltransferase Ste14